MPGSAQYLEVAALSHDGLVRDHNEDSLVVGPWTLCASVTTNPQTLLLPLIQTAIVAVADGLGGHPAGELASTLVVQELARLGRYLDDEDAIRIAVEHANRIVYEAMKASADRLMMGTTVAGIVATEEHLRVFNVGDSRVYAVSGTSLRRLSVDDSPPLRPGERSTHIVTGTIGGHPAYQPVEVHVSTLPLGEHSRLLVCTDGLSDVVDDERIAALLSEHDHGGRAAFELWQAAIEGGGPDNITLAVVDVSAGGLG